MNKNQRVIVAATAAWVIGLWVGEAMCDLARWVAGPPAPRPPVPFRMPCDCPACRPVTRCSNPRCPLPYAHSGHCLSRKDKIDD
jgi:hypothetical protein